MTYRGKVSKKVVKGHEIKLRRFTVIYLLMGVLLLLASMTIPKIMVLWNDNVIFGIGSYIVYGSLLQNRYFDVKKNSNPSFADVQPDTFSQFWSKIELAFKHMWVVGSLLLFLSRWLKV